MLGMMSSPPPPPPPPPPLPPKKRKLGEKPYLEKNSYLGIVYSECFYTTGNIADNVKGNYDTKFLEAIDFAFKKYLRQNNCKVFMQSLPVMMILLKLQKNLASLFATCYIVVRLICL